MSVHSLSQDLNQYVLLETLDILGDLIHRYGGKSLFCFLASVHVVVYAK